MTEHHHRHHHERNEQDELTEAAHHAPFDLGADVAQPLTGSGHTAFDAEADLAVDGEPPELRD